MNRWGGGVVFEMQISQIKSESENLKYKVTKRYF